jgi:hypothetical protein
MSAPLAWLRVGWPRQVDPDQTVTLGRVLATHSESRTVVEAVGHSGTVDHQIGVRHNRLGGLTRQLRSALPGANIRPEDRLINDLNRAVSLNFSSRQRQLRVDELQLSRALLAALSATGHDEMVILQWQLGRTLHPEAIPSQPGRRIDDSWWADLLWAPFGTGHQDSERRRALAAKRSESGWKAQGRSGVRAETDARCYQLIRDVLNALRLAESPGVTLLAHGSSARAVARASRPWLWPLRLNAKELAAVASWPQSATIDLAVERTASRLAPPSRDVARRGRVVAVATFPGRSRPLALSLSASLRHLHALGPTGTGKSTLLLNLIVQDIEAGRSVVVIEPKGDLINDVLGHIPAERLPDVVLLDPSDGVAPVGLNPLAPHGRPPELVADQLLSVFRQLSPSWGPRLEQLLHASLLTLAKTPGATLVALPLLLSNDGYRRSVTSRIDDPVALNPYWRAFESWSPAERATAVAPVMNRLLPFLQRPQLRAVLGQVQPRFNVSQLFWERKILLVDLTKGTLGASTSALLGGLVLAQVWQATLGRTAIPAAQRHPVFVTVDEFQDYLVTPTDLGDALGQARGLGVGFALAHQHLDQLDTKTYSAVMANARNRVAFQLADDDARVLARSGRTLVAEDFTSLASFECYAQLVAEGAVQPWASAKTLPPPATISDPSIVRAASQANYGMPRHLVDADIEQLIKGGSSPKPAADLGPRPRRPAGPDEASQNDGDRS